MCSTASFWERGLSLWFEICRVLKPFQLCFAAKTHESMSVSCFFLLRKVCSQVFGPWKISQNGTRKWSRWFYPNLLKLVAKLDTFDIFCFYGILAFCKSVLAAKSCFELDFLTQMLVLTFHRKPTYYPRRQIETKHFQGFVLDTVGILPRTEHKLCLKQLFN